MEAKSIISNEIESEKDVEGVPIVLTALPTEISHFNYDSFVAFVCAFPNKIVPKKYLQKYVQPENNEDHSAKFMPYGLRKVEALLIEHFGENHVVSTHPDNLHNFVGPKTKVIGISTMDPMGLAYVSTTYSSIFGFPDKSVNAVEFEKLLSHPTLKRYKPKIVVGGAGAWQINDSNKQDYFGIDCIVQGEAEEILLSLFTKIINDQPVPKVIIGKKPLPESIPIIKRAATYGLVEITRGCGRGCQFCSPTMRNKHSFSLDHILKEVEVNIQNGSKMIFLNTEDMFLYKSGKGFIPNRKEVVKLYKKVAEYPGVEYIQLSHASLAPVKYDPKMIEELTPILMEKTRWVPEHKKHYRNRFITVEIGIETGSVKLMKKYMKGKALPYKIDTWRELVPEAIGILNDNDWYPLCTIMTGLPDETEEDTIQTLELLDDLKHAKMFFTPILFIPLQDSLLSNSPQVDLNYLSEAQWEFVSRCWKYNIDFWIPSYKPLIFPSTVIAHLLYFRWKHGPKITRPMMEIAGFPEFMIGGRVSKECSPEYCQEEDTRNGLHKIFSVVKHNLPQLDKR